MAPRIRFAVGGAIFGQSEPEHIRTIGRLGFPGFEPYRGSSLRWLDKPQELKKLLDENDVTLITCSNGGPDQSTDFIDPANRQKTIDDHMAFARDFLKVFGCEHFKINMGRRPGLEAGSLAARASAEPGHSRVAGGSQGTVPGWVANVNETLNQLGRRTIEELGIKLAAHAHIWGPIERPEEIDAMIAGTDPRYVWFLPDTAQINLGGGDPVAIMEKHYARIPAVHFKDSRPEYHGWTGPTPTQEQHRERILYQDLGAGGVDHETIYRNLVKRGYDGWITLDLDPPRANEGEGSVEDKLLINRRYVTDTLKATL